MLKLEDFKRKLSPLITLRNADKNNINPILLAKELKLRKQYI
jgi:hypothetical protein